MHPDYEGVKFYSENDLGIGWALEKAEPIIIGFDAENSITDINAIIELFNIQKLLECGTRLKKWSDAEYNEYKSKAKTITGVIGKFFEQIDDSTFIENYKKITLEYIDDFWELFEKYKCYKNVSPGIFEEFLSLTDTPLYMILSHKVIVQAYDIQLAKELRTSDQTCRILISKFLEENDSKYFLPQSFLPNEYETVFQKYIDSDEVNPKRLHLIFNAQSSKECPISPKLKLNAKRKYDEFWKKSEENVVRTGYGLKMSFVDQDEDIVCQMDGMNMLYSYDIKWLEENLDYPTILNNFKYCFEMFDRCFRSTLVSVKSKISAIEDAFAIKGKKYYQTGNHFHMSERISSLQMHMYYHFLEAHGIDMESIFKWFFDTYIPEEFGITGFVYKASSATDYVEKCRNLASEMDGILKQYRMYVRDGVIDRELFEIESEHLKIDGMQSLMKDKYGYPNGDEIQKEMYMLFSNQSLLSYIKRTESKYHTLFDLLMNERCDKSDFNGYQGSSIDWLIKRGDLTQNTEGEIEVNLLRVAILKDLYEHDVICIQYFKRFSDVLNEMINNGDIRIENTLFSKPEKDYLNYVLNKAEYSNGLDLRNKYSHSTYPQNEDVQKRDYIELLKVMVLIITKMNEEFCWIDDRKSGE